MDRLQIASIMRNSVPILPVSNGRHHPLDISPIPSYYRRPDPQYLFSGERMGRNESWMSHRVEAPEELIWILEIDR